MNKALGKGLSALIPEKTIERNEQGDIESFVQIETSLIDNNTFQPRKVYDTETLRDLKMSIQEKGILQPILVRPKDNRYEVVAGERRLRVARELKLSSIPVMIKPMDDHEVLVLALVENIQREELNPIEEANAFQRLGMDFGYSHEQIAQAVGKERSTVSNILRLLNLPNIIQEKVAIGALSMGHARTLLAVPTEVEQQELYQKVVSQKLSVRELEELVSRGIKKNRLGKPKEAKTPGILQVEDGLKQLLGTKVDIRQKSRGGTIVIDYYSADDLKRIIQLVIKTTTEDK